MSEFVSDVHGKATRWYSESLIAKPSAERPPGNTLETLPDDLDEATHKDLDRKVLVNNPTTNLEAYLQLSNPALLEAPLLNLLQQIVSNSPETLDQKYRDIVAAQKLLQDRPELKEELKSSWMEGKFKRIRNLSAPLRDLYVSYIMKTLTQKSFAQRVVKRHFPVKWAGKVTTGALVHNLSDHEPYITFSSEHTTQSTPGHISLGFPLTISHC